MITRRDMLTGAASLAAFPASAQESGLKAIAASRGILFGTAAATYEFKDADFVAALKRDAAIITPEYEMKRNVMEKRAGQLDFTATDTLFQFARANGMAMRAHPLIWHVSNPAWLEERLAQSRDERLLTAYVAALAGRYRGQLHSLDVVNEALAQDGSGFRQTLWLKAFGPRYIDMAFDAARAADPNALLVYNDFGCENRPLLRAPTLKLLDGMLARGVPVGALGMQAHLSAFGPRVDQRGLRDFLAAVSSRGLSIIISELDVDDEGGPPDFAARDQAVADEASRFLEVALDNPAIRTVITWSLSDRYLDPPTNPMLKQANWQARRVPYDRQIRKKPLWGALARAFAGRRTP